MTLEFTGTVNGDEIGGTVTLGAFGSSSFTGTRTYSARRKLQSTRPIAIIRRTWREVAKVPGTGVGCLTERTDVPSPTVFRCRTRSFRSSANK